MARRSTQQPRPAASVTAASRRRRRGPRVRTGMATGATRSRTPRRRPHTAAMEATAPQTRTPLRPRAATGATGAPRPAVRPAAAAAAAPGRSCTTARAARTTTTRRPASASGRSLRTWPRGRGPRWHSPGLPRCRGAAAWDCPYRGRHARGTRTCCGTCAVVGASPAVTWRCRRTGASRLWCLLLPRAVQLQGLAQV